MHAYTTLLLIVYSHREGHFLLLSKQASMTQVMKENYVFEVVKKCGDVNYQFLNIEILKTRLLKILLI